VKPVRVDIVTYAPTAFFHCQHCEVAFDQLGIGPRVRHIEADESLPVDLQLEYLDLSDWVRDLHQRNGAAVAIRVIDAASLLGVWTSWRHGVRSYPAVIVGGQRLRVGRRPSPPRGGGRGSGRRVGHDYHQLDPVIDRQVADAMSKGGSTT
jgi:hypothetical protein